MEWLWYDEACGGARKQSGMGSLPALRLHDGLLSKLLAHMEGVAD
jgi:hypothetical protein